MVFVGCEKESVKSNLAEESVSFESTKDSIQFPVSILKDSLMVLNIKAKLSGEKSAKDVWVTLAVDTTKITEFKERFGDAKLLPSSSYVFFKKNVLIKNGEDLSETAELNFGNQTKLTEYTTYVLPVVVQAVDGETDGAASKKTLFYVFKTGKPLFVNRTGWTIHSYSSQNATFSPNNLIDNNDRTTYWLSNITQNMPQWVIINFNKEVDFTAVNYYFPNAVAYPSGGGYATVIKIETSMDAITWVDKGTFSGNLVDKMQTLSIGETKARYLRFTALSVIKFSGFDVVFVSGISLTP